MSDTTQLAERTRTHIGVAGAGLNFVTLTVVGVVVLQAPTYSGVAGLFAGTGSYFFLPWFLGFAQIRDDEAMAPIETAIEATPGSVRLAVVGLGLEAGGILMLAVALGPVAPDLTTGIGVGIVATVAVSLVGGAILSRSSATYS